MLTHPSVLPPLPLPPFPSSLPFLSPFLPLSLTLPPETEPLSVHVLLDTPTDTRMYIDAGEVIRMRVEADEFYDDEPGPVQKPEINGPVKAAQTGENKRPPYTIIVSARSILND